jgi:hypothetical protein
LYARLRRTTRRLARLGRVSGCRWSGRVALAAPNTGEGQQRGQTWQSMQSCSGIQSCQSIERLQGVIPWCQGEEQGVSGCRWSGRVALAAPDTGEGQQRGQTWQSMQSCSGIQSCQSIECLQGVIPWCQREEQGRISMAQYYYSRSTSCATRHTLLWQMRVYSRCSRCSHRGGAELPEDKYAQNVWFHCARRG